MKGAAPDVGRRLDDIADTWRMCALAQEPVRGLTFNHAIEHVQWLVGELREALAERDSLRATLATERITYRQLGEELLANVSREVRRLDESWRAAGEGAK